MQRILQWIGPMCCIAALGGCRTPAIAWIDVAKHADERCIFTEPGVRQRDSSGVRIVEHSAESTMQLSTPDLVARIAGRDSAGQEPFGRVLGAVARSGAILLADSTTSEVFLYDSLGRFVRRIGRPGEGPGDYRRLGRLFSLRGDSTAITDQKGTRLTVLAPDGSVARIGRLRGIPWDQDLLTEGGIPGLVTLVGRFADGRYLGIQGVNDQDDPSGLKVGQPAVRFNRGWLVLLDEHDGSAVRLRDIELKGHVFYQWDAGFSFAPFFFSSYATASASGDSYWYTSGREFQVDRFARDGTWLLSIRLCRAPERVTEGDVRRAWDAWASDNSEIAGEFVPGTPAPTTFSSWRVHSFTGDSAVWMEELGRPDSARVWWVFSPGGTLIRKMLLPAGRDVYAINAGQMIAIVSSGKADERVEVFASRSEW